jgi:hypothetical protein
LTPRYKDLLERKFQALRNDGIGGTAQIFATNHPYDDHNTSPTMALAGKGKHKSNGHDSSSGSASKGQSAPGTSMIQ